MSSKKYLKVLFLGASTFLLSHGVYADHQDFSQQLPALSPTLQSTCDDLYSAACGTDDGTGNTSTDRMRQVSKVLANNVKEAKQKLLTELKVSSFFEGLKKFLAANGFKVTTEVTVDVQNTLLEGFGEKRASVNLQDFHFFKETQTCQQQSEEFKNSLINMSYTYLNYPRNHASDVQTLETMENKLTQAESWLNELAPARKKSYSDNFQIVLIQMTEKCRDFNKLPPVQKSESALKNINFLCTHLADLRDLTIEKFRNPHDSEIKEKVSIYLDKALDLLKSSSYYSIIFGTSNTQMPPATPFDFSKAATPLIGPLAKVEQKAGSTGAADRQLSYLKTRAANLANEIGRQNPCYETGNSTYRTERIKTLSKQYVASLLTSKIFMETLINKYYSEDSKAKTQKTFDEVKALVLQQALLLTKDPAQIENLRIQFATLEMAWLDMPQNKEYTQHPILGLEVLRDDAIMQRQLTSTMFPVAFGDTSLEFFRGVNAFYMPSTQVGAFKKAAMVNMMPFFSFLRDREPFAFISVLAHEIGHQIGPRLSSINGFSMIPLYLPILQCYAQPASIHMGMHQMDETMSDTIAAEVVAKMIAGFSQEKKIPAVISSVSPFCYFEHLSMKSGGFYPEDPHPISKLRVAGIFGANSSLRKILGCSQDSPRFKTCQWPK